MVTSLSDHSTLLRHWQLLRLVPRHPAKRTAADLNRSLEKHGFRVSKRTIERDLISLSRQFAIVEDDRSKPYGWSWQKGSAVLDVPGLTTSQALTFAMVQKFLGPLLPVSLTDEIEPYFDNARKHLDTFPRSRGTGAWTEKVRVVQPAQTLQAPTISQDVLRPVYEALLHSQQIKIVYQKRGTQTPVEYTVHPLGIVQRGPVTYLVCTLFNYEDVLLLAMHRVQSALMLEDQARRPASFNLDQFIQVGRLNFGSGKTMRLEAIFINSSAEHLHETPLSLDQKITPVGDNRVKVTATVADTPQISWWLLGFGEDVEVLKPRSLRDSLTATAAAMHKLYQKKTR